MPFLGRIGSGELIVIGVILFLLFGKRILNGLARNLGRTVHELGKSKKEFDKFLADDDIEEDK